MLHNIIPSQRFELVRDAIGRVLVAEFAAQKTLVEAYNHIHEHDTIPVLLTVVNPTVWLERVCPFDKEELPVINIVYSDTNFVDETTAFTSNGESKFFIEIYANASSSSIGEGDKKAAILLAKIGGMIRAILMDNKNRNLDFTDYKIQSRFIKSFTRTQPRVTNDAENTIAGIVEAHYFGEETTETETGVLETKLHTSVKISDTEKGYKYELITT